MLASLPLNLSARLEKLQRRAIRIILNLPYRHPLSDDHYQNLKISPLHLRRNLASVCYGFKLYHVLVPRALHPFCPVIPSAARPVRFPRVQIPGVSVPSRNFDRSPVIYSTMLLNRLPRPLLLLPNVSQFKTYVWNNFATTLS